MDGHSTRRGEEPMPPVPVVAVVLAAGFGTRFDPDDPKQLVAVAGKPMVCWSIEAFEANPSVSDVVVAVNPQVRGHVESLVEEGGYRKVRGIVDGGEERVDSTLAVLALLGDNGIPAQAKVLIHDAVRPFVEQSAIDGCIAALDRCSAATVAVPSTDTMLVARRQEGRTVVGSVPERACMFRAQTPQAFRYATIVKAYALAAHDPGFSPTDDTRVVVEYLPDEPVDIVPGSESNMKVTTRADLPVAELIAERLRDVS